MTAQNKFDFAVHERNHKIGVFLARNAEDMRDAFFLETLDEKIGCFHRAYSPIFNFTLAWQLEYPGVASRVNRLRGLILARLARDEGLLTLRL